MAEGLGRDRWAHTSMLCALIANANRDPKKGRAFKPADFDPYRHHGGDDVVEVNETTIGLLKEAFVARKGS